MKIRITDANHRDFNKEFKVQWINKYKNSKHETKYWFCVGDRPVISEHYLGSSQVEIIEFEEIPTIKELKDE